MNKKFSFIIATCGRDQDVRNLLDSIYNLNYDLNTIEIIIMDQNSDFRINTIVSNYARLTIKHIKSDKLGLSYNRNRAIDISIGEYLCFPDDDSLFYPDTLLELDKIIKNYNNVSIYFGCIYDRKLKQYVLKNWPRSIKSIGLYNAFFVSTSTTIFVKNCSGVKFNESLGLGTSYGSCEDIDYSMRMISLYGKGVYSPNIQVYHPKPVFSTISLTKTKSYAAGFGYFISNDFSIPKLYYLFLLIIKSPINYFILYYIHHLFPKHIFITFTLV